MNRFQELTMGSVSSKFCPPTVFLASVHRKDRDGPMRIEAALLVVMGFDPLTHKESTTAGFWVGDHD